jgi:hypothetical protein
MNRKVPINRLSKFFGDKDFSLELEMGQEWLYGDMNFTLVLYQIDQSKTKKSNVYGEVEEDGIVYKTPVEFKAYVRVMEPQNENLGSTKLRNLEPGNIQISVYISELEELGIDIKYGDYIGYYETESRVRYYTVVNDGKVTSDNKHTYGGVYPYYRTIIASPVKDNEFRGN